MNTTPRTDAAVLYCADKYYRLYPDSKIKPVDDDFARQLEQELNAALKLPHAMELQSFDRQILELQDKLAAALVDKERLDWLAVNYHNIQFPSANNRNTFRIFSVSNKWFEGNTLRQAIDAAISSQEKEPK